jgi:hypothetical protein
MVNLGMCGRVMALESEFVGRVADLPMSQLRVETREPGDRAHSDGTRNPEKGSNRTSQQLI